jgi:cholesterol transport system auxiliary component
MIRLIFMAAVLLGLAGCSMFSPVQNPKLYVINKVPAHVPTRHKSGNTIQVQAPDSSPIYSTNDMAYTTTPYQISYFAKNTWAEAPAIMLKPLMVQTLQKTHHYNSVTTSDTLVQTDFVLHTQLLQLQQDFGQGGSYVHLQVRAQLVRSATGTVVATKLFDVTAPAPQASPYGGVIAANQAAEEFLQQLARFCLKYT